MSLALARPISCSLPLTRLAFALQHPRSMDEMERPRSRRDDVIAGACSATHYACRQWLSLPTANPPNSAQLGGIPYHSTKLHPGPCNSVGMWPQTDTDRQTHRRAWPQYISRGLWLTWNVITLNHPRAVAMRPVVKLLWPLVSFTAKFDQFSKFLHPPFQASLWHKINTV